MPGRISLTHVSQTFPPSYLDVACATTATKASSLGPLFQKPQNQHALSYFLNKCLSMTRLTSRTVQKKGPAKPKLFLNPTWFPHFEAQLRTLKPEYHVSLREIRGTTELGLATRNVCRWRRGRSLHNQDPPCTLNWGYMVLNSGYIGPNRG